MTGKSKGATREIKKGHSRQKGPAPPRHKERSGKRERKGIAENGQLISTGANRAMRERPLGRRGTGDPIRPTSSVT